MIVYRNKTSGKGFALVEMWNQEEAILVTPANQVKRLKLKHFYDQEEYPDYLLLSMGYITLTQIETCKKGKELREKADKELENAKRRERSEKITKKDMEEFLKKAPPQILQKIAYDLGCELMDSK